MSNEILWSEEGKQWASAVQKYLDLYSGIRHAPSTKRRNFAILWSFAMWLKGEGPTLNRVEEWMAHRVREGKSKATANLELSVIRACARWAVARGYYPKDPTELAEDIPYHLQEKGRFIPLEDAKKTLDYLKVHSRMKWLHQMLTVMIETGCRVGELIWLRCQDVSLGDRCITIKPREDWSPKDRSIRIVPLTQIAYQVILEQLIGKTEGYVWSTKSGKPIGYRNALRALYRVGKSIGLESINFKSFRSLFATELASHLTANQLAVIMGHSTPYVTQKHYIHPKHMGVKMPSVLAGH